MALKISFPSISSKLPPDVQQFLQRVREAFHKGGVVTEDDLLAAGIASRAPSGSLVPGAVDYSTPPAPTGVTAAGTITAILLQWDNPEDIGWTNFAYAEVWRSEENNLGTAVVLGTSGFITYVDPVEPASTYYYWVRFVSRADVAGPFHSTVGVTGSTNDSPERILDILSESITASELHQSLGQRIDLVDGEGAGSVNARIATEANARAQAILDEASARSGGDSSLQQQINVLAAASSGDLSDLIAAVESEATARASGDAAEATARETLASQLRGNYTGTDSSQVTTGLIYSERSARVEADGALASSINAIGATVTSNYNTLDSAITTEATARASGDATNATSISTVQAQVTIGTKGGLLPSGFDTTVNWTSAVAGSPTAVATSSYLSVVTDSVLGVCGEITLSSTARLLTKGVLPAISGKKYRVTALVKVVGLSADGSFGLHMAAHGLDTSYAQPVSVSAPSATVISAAGTFILSATFSDTASTGVVAWPLGAVYLRFALRLSTTETAGPLLRVQYLRVDDVTDTETLSAAIQTEATTRASQTGDLYAQYTVKLDVGGKVSGFGLASTGPTGAGSIFEIRADKIAFAAPYGVSGASIVPFAVDTLTGIVAMDGAYIKSASVGTAKIENLAVTDAKIATLTASKLTSGEIVGKEITLGEGGNIRSGQTAFNTGYGFWLGTGIDGYARLSVGSPDGPGLDYDESTGEFNFRGIMELKSGSTVPQSAVLGVDFAELININSTTIDGAKITSGTITAGQIGAHEITADHLSADAIDTISLTATESVQEAIDGTITTTGGISVVNETLGKRVELGSGDITFFMRINNVDVPYKSLKVIRTGVCANGQTVNIGYFPETPIISLSPKSLMSFNKDYNSQSQQFVLNANSIYQDPATKLWQFTAQCELQIYSASYTVPGSTGYGSFVPRTRSSISVGASWFDDIKSTLSASKPAAITITTPQTNITPAAYLSASASLSIVCSDWALISGYTPGIFPFEWVVSATITLQAFTTSWINVQSFNVSNSGLTKKITDTATFTFNFAATLGSNASAVRLVVTTSLPGSVRPCKCGSGYVNQSYHYMYLIDNPFGNPITYYLQSATITKLVDCSATLISVNGVLPATTVAAQGQANYFAIG